MTNNRIKGVLLGAGVTAVIQSSSAVTVMAVGFVNSGIMALNQVVGIIMGANIGTCITSWLLSLTGIESSNVFLTMLKPSTFSPILALIGIVLYMFCKSEKKKELGSILLGFSTLMFGMEAMSGAVAPLESDPAFTGVFTMFSNPILGVLVGMILTAIIQSSSASVGILQALSATGAISVGAAFPIILGQNIGTCITALISSIGTNKNAKRTAVIHLTFNIIGVVCGMALFYGANAIFHFAFLDKCGERRRHCCHSHRIQCILHCAAVPLWQAAGKAVLPDRAGQGRQDAARCRRQRRTGRGTLFDVPVLCH